MVEKESPYTYGIIEDTFIQNNTFDDTLDKNYYSVSYIRVTKSTIFFIPYESVGLIKISNLIPNIKYFYNTYYENEKI